MGKQKYCFICKFDVIVADSLFLACNSALSFLGNYYCVTLMPSLTLIVFLLLPLQSSLLELCRLCSV